MAGWGGFFGGGVGEYATNKKFRGGVNDFLFGKDPNLEKFDQWTPEQQGLFGEQTGGLKGSYGSAMDILKQYLEPGSEAYQAFANPYMQEFEQQTIPGLSERFAGMGAQGGALSSSGFGQALGAAGGNLQTNLAQLRAQLQQKATGDIFGEYNRALGQQPFGYKQNPGKEGQLGNIIAAIVKAFSGG